MKVTLSIFSLLFALVFSTSCSKDNDDEVTSIVATWQLVSWSIDIQMDLNNDAVYSMNLLEESECENSETLIFESNGTFSSNRTYNPTVHVGLVNGTTEDYIFEVECDLEGTIGLTGSYAQNGNLIVLSNNNTAMIDGNSLIIVYENAIDIYNEDFTEILTSKDLTLVYYKK